MQRRNIPNGGSSSVGQQQPSLTIGTVGGQATASNNIASPTTTNENEILGSFVPTVGHGTGGVHNGNGSSSNANANTTTTFPTVGNHKRTNSRDKIVIHDTLTSRNRWIHMFRTIVCSNTCLLCIAMFLTLISYMISPNDYETLERDAIQAEKDFMEYIQKSQQHSPPQMNHPDDMDPTMNHDTNNIQQQPPLYSFSWVDGEKKLKKELQKLVILQQKGQELGVPVLTRWLGDDIPVYAGSTNVPNVTEWKINVQKDYEKMRIEEEEWKRTLLLSKRKIK